MTAEHIIQRISAFIGYYNVADFYIGITNDYRRRLIHEHNVRPELGVPCIVSMADTDVIARMVEAHFLNLGMSGGGGGDKNCRYIYVYYKTPQTRQ